METCCTRRNIDWHNNDPVPGSLVVAHPASAAFPDGGLVFKEFPAKAGHPAYGKWITGTGTDERGCLMGRTGSVPDAIQAGSDAVAIG
jgi:hypothetical protein